MKRNPSSATGLSHLSPVILFPAWPAPSVRFFPPRMVFTFTTNNSSQRSIFVFLQPMPCCCAVVFPIGDAGQVWPTVCWNHLQQRQEVVSAFCFDQSVSQYKIQVLGPPKQPTPKKISSKTQHFPTPPWKTCQKMYEKKFVTFFSQKMRFWRLFKA